MDKVTHIIPIVPFHFSSFTNNLTTSYPLVIVDNQPIVLLILF
ncbi:hypothetical protein BAOM_3865 [Peribacillus asahii]|uniref:Uncharacterized protein n=1 Tax=Peribacillus asahii TaxID=228899 RepID=A0A3Q9RRB0_9BACI|nr:hypothetical protein BAOM_3865 [Peribacillus asahii]